MKKRIIILISLFFLLSLESYAQKDSLNWNKTKELEHLNNRQDSTKWNIEMLKQDIKYRNSKENRLPINFGAWPVPEYSLLGEDTFNGVGNGGNFTGIDLNEKKLLYSFFSVNKNRFNQKSLNNKPNEVFFSIVILTDFIDTKDYSHAGIYISSRNNPDYIGEGFFKTKNNKIDYLAFLTSNRDEYAIVNMRLFNLKHGRTILIAPQEDGSLRSMQIESPILSDIEIENFIKSLLEKKNVKTFFLKQGTI
ncbi:hypothetical protein GCM10011506_08400 [Marivirga lumbricoides]|uniref:Uncharacterized protein n=1 Tax=Marivirga lumbricoides TaxID=1046115 RepID=A0ABQ1LIU8_9BACT|nr:hypothetical protein GCM10011506_08400 [Marivirga lumbricoides]